MVVVVITLDIVLSAKNINTLEDVIMINMDYMIIVVYANIRRI